MTAKSIRMFDEFLLEAVSVPEIHTVADVEKFFHYLIYDLRINMHPDTPFSDYVETGTDRPTFDAGTAKKLDAAMDACFSVCEAADKDIYDIGFQIMKDFMKDAYDVEIGSDIGVDEMDMSFVGGEIATNFEALVAAAVILTGVAGAALSAFKEDVRKALKKKGKDRAQAVERALMDVKERMRDAA